MFSHAPHAMAMVGALLSHISLPYPPPSLPPLTRSSSPASSFHAIPWRRTKTTTTPVPVPIPTSAMAILACSYQRQATISISFPAPTASDCSAMAEEGHGGY
ncbi:hypothetical protein BS78_10G138200 [Paspalum vaginatum]|nr:hypothetical protein BS78_10G138200 [Paspalum vaginatum]